MRLARPTTALATLVKGAWDYFRDGEGWMTTAMAVESMSYLNSEDIQISPGQGPNSVRVACSDTRSKAPDIEISMNGMWSDASTPMYYGLDAAKYGVASFLVYNAKPKSTGEVKISSRSPEDKPIIDPKLLSEEDDMRRLILAVRFALSLAATMRHKLDFDFGPASVPGWDSKKGGWTDAKEAMLSPSSFGEESPADRAFDFVDPAALADEVSVLVTVAVQT
jgi:choline dehydrogenase-like flavoprotein